MQFQRNTSIAKSNGIIKVLIKVFLILLVFGIATILIDKIDFPSPNKKIEKTIPNENFKIIK
jgi:hypothetical protein